VLVAATAANVLEVEELELVVDIVVIELELDPCWLAGSLSSEVKLADTPVPLVQVLDDTVPVPLTNVTAAHFAMSQLILKPKDFLRDNF
jgi:hypothetical protein